MRSISEIVMSYSVEQMQRDSKVNQTFKNSIHTKPRKNMLSKREFYGDEHFIWCQKQFEEARVFLKNCGRPKDEHDRFLIEEAKYNSKYFKAAITDEEVTTKSDSAAQ